MNFYKFVTGGGDVHSVEYNVTDGHTDDHVTTEDHVMSGVHHGNFTLSVSPYTYISLTSVLDVGVYLYRSAIHMKELFDTVAAYGRFQVGILLLYIPMILECANRPYSCRKNFLTQKELF